MSYIDEVIRAVVNREGGYVDDPLDAGGATKYGITRATLAAWRKKPVTKQDVKDLTVEEASEIYKHNYVAPFLKLEHDIVAEQLFDSGVNHGVTKTKKMFQTAIGVTPDGVIGPRTVAKFKELGPEIAYRKFMAERLQYYALIIERNRSQVKFACGWMNRCAEMIERYMKASGMTGGPLASVVRHLRSEAKKQATWGGSVLNFRTAASMMEPRYATP